MKITFGLWFRAKKCFSQTWGESKARNAHEARQLYGAIICDGSNSSCYVEVANDYIGVEFLDASLREYMSYQFQELEPGRLFLTMATLREFDGNSDTVKSGVTYYFKPDGASS